ncbi:MAG: hypothetical protein H0U50_08645 [Pyrinomonadaceae bacterium]|nr:hypothetical protein [Pyrinomonadaceae bacterium]
MKRNLMKIIGAAVLTVSAILVTTFGFVIAQDKSEDRSIESNLRNSNSGGQLDGTWDVAVTIRNCQTNAPIRTISELNTFMFGGTMMNTTAGVPQSRRTVGHGVWQHSRGNEYTFSYKAFNFDANGVFTGSIIVRQFVLLDSLRNEYSSFGMVEFYDANGNLLPSRGCSTTTATRFE